MNSDSPIVDEVRARAMAISARYAHDLRAYAAHLADVQRAHAERVVDQPRVVVGGTKGEEGAASEAEVRRTKPAA